MASDIDTRFRAIITQVGSAKEGGTTESETPLITGSAAAFATVDVYDSATLLGVVQANGQGAWSLQLSTPLFNGIHDFSAVQAADYESDRQVNYFAVTVEATEVPADGPGLLRQLAEAGRDASSPSFPPNLFKSHSMRPVTDDTLADTKGHHLPDGAAGELSGDASSHGGPFQVTHMAAPVNGGKAFDMVAFLGDHLVLDLSAVTRAPSLTNPDAVAGFDLLGHHNALRLTAGDVLNFGEHDLFIDDGKPQLVVNGKEGDSVDLTNSHVPGVLDGNWEHHGTADVGGVLYNVVEHSTTHAELLVQQAVRIEVH